MQKFTCPSCKYEFVQDYIHGKKEQDFITTGKIKPIALYLSNSIKIHTYGELHEEDEQVQLYACPYCKTVIINI